jgi:hypothetical protein
MVIEELGRNFVKCQIITGSKDQIGNSVLIPRIVLSAPDDQHIPLTRRQFPLRLGFSMTTNEVAAIVAGNFTDPDFGKRCLAVPFTCHGEENVWLPQMSNNS